MDAVVGELLAAGPDQPTNCSARAAARWPTSSRGIERLGGFGGRSDVLAESMTFDGKADAYLDQLEARHRDACAGARPRPATGCRRATTR